MQNSGFCFFVHNTSKEKMRIFISVILPVISIDNKAKTISKKTKTTENVVARFSVGKKKMAVGEEVVVLHVTSYIGNCGYLFDSHHMIECICSLNKWRVTRDRCLEYSNHIILYIYS